MGLQVGSSGEHQQERQPSAHLLAGVRQFAPDLRVQRVRLVEQQAPGGPLRSQGQDLADGGGRSRPGWKPIPVPATESRDRPARFHQESGRRTSASRARSEISDGVTNTTSGRGWAAASASIQPSGTVFPFPRGRGG